MEVISFRKKGGCLDLKSRYIQAHTILDCEFKKIVLCPPEFPEGTAAFWPVELFARLEMAPPCCSSPCLFLLQPIQGNYRIQSQRLPETYYLLWTLILSQSTCTDVHVDFNWIMVLWNHVFMVNVRKWKWKVGEKRKEQPGSCVGWQGGKPYFPVPQLDYVNWEER